MSVRSKSTSKVETPGEGKGDGDELPEGWAISSVGDCFLDVRNGTTATQNKSGTGIPVSRIETIQNCRFDMSRVQYLDDVDDEFVEHFRYRPGDIAFSHINSFEHVGKTALYNGEPEVFIHGMNLLRLRLGHESIEPRFAQLFMQTKFFREEVRQRVGHAVNQVSINQRNLAEVPFVLPPLAEQRRIVAKLEALLSKVSTTQQRLSHLPTLLKRFRQSVLAAACSGRLTADWREENPEVQTVAELLCSFASEDALTKKRAGRLWGAGEVPELTDDEINGLPDTWAWTKVGTLGTDPTDAVQVGPMSMQSREFTPDGVPVLNVGCIQWHGFDESKLDFLPRERADSFSRYRIAPDDILFTRSGTVGRCAVATERQRDWLMTFHLLRVRLNSGKCLPKYLLSVLRGSPNVLRQTTGAAIGSTRAGFNTRLLAELDVPLAPLAEQHEIVSRVEKLFAFADQIEARLKQAQAHVDRLTQSLLAKAFRGELVPTEAELARQEGRSYESASELLERIRATKGDDAPTKRKRGKASKP